MYVAARGSADRCASEEFRVEGDCVEFCEARVLVEAAPLVVGSVTMGTVASACKVMFTHERLTLVD